MIVERTKEQLEHHYQIEKALANKLRKSTKEERRTLYTEAYDELFREVPSHPQLARKASIEESKSYVKTQLQLLDRFISQGTRFMEIGPGDCSLSFDVANKVREVFAIDVSNEITRAGTDPENFKLIISDGSSIPVPENSIDVVYSNQLMEHLHPDDAEDQLQNIVAALNKGGKYICITPNRFSGPHDISVLFDDEATGFHLKEYTNAELAKLFKKTGFSKIETYIGGKGLYIKTPTILLITLEKVLSILPNKISKSISRASRGVLQNCQIVGIK